MVQKGDGAGDPQVRRSALGSSDAAVVMRCSPWNSYYRLWMEKAGRAPMVDKITSAMEAGVRLEVTVLRWWLDRHPGAKLFTLRGGVPVDLRWDRVCTWPRLNQVLGTLRHPDNHRVMCHLDGFAVYVENDVQLDDGRFVIVEAKTGNGRGYGKPGTDEVPEYVWWQCQHQSMVVAAALELGEPLPVQVAFLKASDGLSFQEYRIEPDAIAQAELEYEYHIFWHSIDAGDQPEPEDHNDWVAHAAELVDMDSAVIDCPPEMEDTMLNWHRNRKIKKDVDAFEKEAKIAAMAAMGEAPKMKTPYGTVSWIERSAARKVDWEGIARALVDEHTLDARMEEFTTTQPGGRYLKYTPTKG